MTNDPTITLIGTLIVLQDTAAKAAGANTYIRAAIAAIVIMALIYAKHTSR